jgi:short-subunit dehydrogenase
MTNTETATQFAVITGASSGIGLELAKQFAQHGYDLLITAESARIDAAAAELRALGAKVSSARADLTTYAGVESLYARIRAEGRPVDAICINAGVGVGGPFLENALEDELRLISLNVDSVVHLAKRVLTDMVARNEGRVLFTASIAAEMPAPFEAVYAASKAFVLSFAEAIRNELKDTNVVVTALQPGATETNFFHRAGMDDTKVGAGRKSDPADVARAGFEALMKGKDHVVAAMTKEKIQVAVGQVIPETIKAEQHRKLAEPGSASS